MDKNKSRTDLLAAGRKKLQQFRQKKDGKGSSTHGKPSKKQGKNEGIDVDSDAMGTSCVHTAPLQSAEGESGSQPSESMSSADRLLPQGSEDSEASPDISITSIAPCVVSLPENESTEVLEPHEVVLVPTASKELGVDSSSFTGPESGGNEIPEVLPSSSSNASVESSVAVGRDSLNREDGKATVHTCEYIMDGPLLQAEVTEAADEANDLGSIQHNGSTKLELTRDGICSESELGECEASSISTCGELREVTIATCEVVETDKVSALTSASKDSDELSFPSLPALDPDKNVAACTECGDQQDEQEIDNGCLKMSSVSAEHGVLHDETSDADMREMQANERNQPHPVSRSLEYVDKSHEEHLEMKFTSSSEVLMSHPADLNSVSLSELIKVIKRLSDDEYSIILKARDSDLQPSVSSLVQEGRLSGVVEHLEEELVSTNFTKDFCHIHLEEYSKLQKEFANQRSLLANEISMLQTSLAVLHEKNDSLTKDLLQTRSEHQAVVGERDNLCSQLHSAKAEIQEYSARVCELQNSQEISLENLRSNSRDLADCKSLLAVLQAENEKLNGVVTSVAEESKKLENEKEYFLHENERLSLKLDECQKLVGGLQVEIASSNGSLAMLTESNKKLKEEKESLVCESEMLSTEVADLKSSVVTLEVEKANLHQSLVLLTGDVNKIKEENVHISLECERLSSEALVLQDQLLAEKKEHVQAEEDLKGKMILVEQLTEDNISLCTRLDVCMETIRELSNGQNHVVSSLERPVDQIKNLETHGFESVVNAVGPSEGLGKRNEVSSLVLEKPLSGCHVMGTPDGLFMGGLPDEHPGFVGLRGLLKNMENVVLGLEKAVEFMHSQSASSSESDGKVTVAGVSKLIKAFESKAHLHEHEGEEGPLNEDQSEADPYASSLKQIGNLKAILKQLSNDVDGAACQFSAELEGGKAANLTIGELKVQCETLKEHSDTLEASTIDLGILYEVVKRSMSDLETNHSQLETHCEVLKHQNTVLRAENDELVDKLGECQLRMKDLETCMHELQRSSDETASVLHRQLESLQTETTERIVVLQLEWNAFVTEIVETVSKLDKHTSSVSIQNSDGLDVNSHIAFPVSSAIEVIEHLQGKLEEFYRDREAMIIFQEEANKKLSELQGNSDLALDILQSLYSNLRKLVLSSPSYVENSGNQMENDEMHNPLDQSHYDTLMGQLGNIIDKRLHTESEIDELRSQLECKMLEIQEINSGCVDMDVIHKLIDDIETVLKLDKMRVDFNGPPLSHLGSLISFLVCKYTEANEHVVFSKDIIGSKEMELTELHEKLIQLNASNLQNENEILILKESIHQAEEALGAIQTQLHEKIIELEQSEQRVSSLREKLSIAVAKGKGLVVQRDNLKYSLAETSSELEKCSQELQLKEARLLELEIKLRTYSEAGERVEALESELSYIRNSANALRESFLLKDSVLQRIEEILEDLDLPEYFHAKDIIDKVEWLARAISGTSLPPTDWEQKSLVGPSQSDAGFVATDSWREDMQPGPNLVDDLRRKYDELQGKFYGLAEQNEMLEQSLMERNNLVQRWEELLNKIKLPSTLRSEEPEDKIDWLCNSLLEADNYIISLQKKIDNLESHCTLLSADLEESHRRIAELEASSQELTHECKHLSERLEVLTRNNDEVSARASHFELENDRLRTEVIAELEASCQELIHERKHLSGRLDVLTRNNDKLSVKASHFELENDRLRTEAFNLHEKMAEIVGSEENTRRMESEIRRLLCLVRDALDDPLPVDVSYGSSSIAVFKEDLQKLIEKYTALSSEESLLSEGVNACNPEKADTIPSGQRVVDTLNGEEPEYDVLKKQLEEALLEVLCLKEERESYLAKVESLLYEVEALDKKREELQGLLNQEEQRSVSLREKLNVAVRKGKSLVQHRDSLKQNIEEMNSEVEHLKSEISRRDSFLAEYEQKIKDLSSCSSRVEVLESEILLLRNKLAETEHLWQDQGSTLSTISSILVRMDVGSEVNSTDPVAKLRQIEQLCHDLSGALASSQQEAKKSKNAVELLLAELNEVQERSDSLQEEITQMASDLAELSQAKDAAEAAKLQALSQFESLSAVHHKERRNLLSEFMKMKSALELLEKVFSDFRGILSDVLAKDNETLHNLETAIGSSLGKSHALDVVGLIKSNSPWELISSYSGKDKFIYTNAGPDSEMLNQFDDNSLPDVCISIANQLQEFFTGIVSSREDLQKHYAAFHERLSGLSESLTVVNKEMIGHRESFQMTVRDVEHLKATHREKDSEIALLRQSVALLCEACSSSLMEIENSRAALADQNLAALNLRENMDAASYSHKGFSDDETHFSSEEFVRSFADGLLSAVKDFACVRAKITDGSQKELKSTIANLQRELQEKDIQKDRICKELVNQIKEAEATASGYSLELQSSKDLVQNLEKKVAAMEFEHALLHQQLKEIQDRQVASTELQERLQSLTDLLASKDQETEALMQALDEEEMQMEQLGRKIEGLEKTIEQKNLLVKDLEVSRGKAMKKLSITVCKFDELHQFSQSLLSEIEKLQVQIKERDSEVSFLRKEVTRCTNDVLNSSQLHSKGSTDEYYEFLTWFDTMISGGVAPDADDKKLSQVDEFKELVQKKIGTIVSELKDLRVAVQSKDTLLQAERSKVENLIRKGESLERSLHEKESQLNLLQGVGDPRELNSLTSEIVEVEPVINKWTVSASSSAPQVRSLRKAGNDQVAIAIDAGPANSLGLEDEDDDKVHGFKSLTTSRIIPKFSRPLTDMVDGLWVSCDRALMRQPALRLGIIMYWAILHTLLASFIV